MGGNQNTPSFYDLGGNQLRRVRDGVWTEQRNEKQMTMRASDTQTLVVALLIPDNQGSVHFATYEYFETASHRPRFLRTGQILHHFLKPQLQRLTGDVFIVKVGFGGKISGKRDSQY